jgi:hypothetical protein
MFVSEADLENYVCILSLTRVVFQNSIQILIFEIPEREIGFPEILIYTVFYIILYLRYCEY